jgi:hypothetical protein
LNNPLIYTDPLGLYTVTNSFSIPVNIQINNITRQMNLIRYEYVFNSNQLGYYEIYYVHASYDIDITWMNIDIIVDFHPYNVTINYTFSNENKTGTFSYYFEVFIPNQYPPANRPTTLRTGSGFYNDHTDAHTDIGIY